MKILIMGMGAIGHTVAATIQNCTIDVLVSNPVDIISVESQDGKYKNRVNQVLTYDTLAEIDYDYLFVTLPTQYKIERLEEIKGKISKNTVIVYMPGNQGILSYMPEELANHEVILFERVIHVSRVVEYGSVVNIMGTKTNMHIAYSDGINKEEFEAMFPQVTNFISNHKLIDILMVSSNPVIHNPRTFRAFSEQNLYKEEFLFYNTWTNEDSNLFIKLEKEVMNINKAIETKNNIKINYYSMFDHFNVDNINPDVDVLTKNISNSPALKQIKFYVASPAELAFNRYIVDDMIISLKFYRTLGEKYQVKTPLMDEMYLFGRDLIESVNPKFFTEIDYPLNLAKIIK